MGGLGCRIDSILEGHRHGEGRVVWDARSTVMLNRYWLSNTWGRSPLISACQGQPKATHPALAARQSLKLITKKYLLDVF
jgi:hypothetical protein